MSIDPQGPPTPDPRLQEVLAAYLQAIEAGQAPDQREWLARHPDLAPELASFFANQQDFARLAAPLGAAPAKGQGAETLAEHPAAASAPEAGERIRYFGDYELLERIAQGGMGVVWKARQVSLNRIVALKMILAGQLATPQEVERFYSEARTAANLQHPNIVAIHEVGARDGQHYFSMDYIEGYSLAAAVRERPLPPHEAAAHIHTVAGAIEFAHRHGVLHRDLKPSNVLLDTAGRPHVTDFGLAKRLDHEAGLTASGAIVGTPSYMPPEQVRAGKTPLGPTCDVYSLGASLYELLVGRPPFQAASALDVLIQVTEVEPVPPRRLNPAISRDLETIVLKCLAKEPRRRYASAAALAEDLQAYLEDRPIKARRPGLVERTARLLWRHRGRALQAAVVAVIAAALALGGWHAWDRYADAQLGRVVFQGAPGLSAEVFDAAGENLVVPRFALPREEPVALPPGDYLVHLGGERQVRETGRLRVLGGEQQVFELRLRDRWENQFGWSDNQEFIHLGKRSASIGLTQGRSRIRCVDAFGDPNHPRWEYHLPRELFQKGATPYGYTKPMRDVLFRSHAYRQLIRPAADLNGDGEPDLLWAAWTGESVLGLLALSGKSGTPLWYHEVAGPLPPGTPAGKYRHRHHFGTKIVPTVAFLEAADGQKVVVLMVKSTGGTACLEGKSWDKDAVTLGRQYWLQALAAKTGQALWHCPLDPKWFAATKAPPLPAVVLRGGGRTLLACVAGTHLVVVDPQTGKLAWPARDLGETPKASPRLLPAGKAAGGPDLLLCWAGERLHAFTFPEGKIAFPVRKLGFRPLREPQLLRAGKPLFLSVRGADPKLELTAHDPVAGKVVWQRPIEAHWARAAPYNPLLDMVPGETPEEAAPATSFAWPVIADLDGDGKDEILVPFGEAKAPYAGLEVLDAATGAVRWRRRWKANSFESLRQPQQIIVGPDLDGDAHREVFVASFGLKQMHQNRDKLESRHHLFVHALSGKDGRCLWAWRHALPRYADARVGRLLWWQPGPDGWPQLVVPYSHGSQPGVATTFVLTAGTGELAHLVPGMTNPQVRDLDGDGMPELFRVERTRPNGIDPYTSQQVVAYRGEPGELWRRPGSWDVVGDLDGDGVADLVGSSGKKTLAISGRDGRVLWQLDEVPGNFTTPWPHADLDGDGVPDLIGSASDHGSPSDRPAPNLWQRYAVSGRTGKKLWVSGKDSPTPDGKRAVDPLKGDADGAFWSHPALPNPECHDLLGNGQGVMLYAYSLIYNRKPQGQPEIKDSKDLGKVIADANTQDRQELCLAAVGGRDGALLWKQVVARWPAAGPFPRRSELRVHPADVDGSGARELVCVVDAPGVTELQLRGGRDGNVRWKLPLEKPSGLTPEGDQRLPILLVGDLDGDGKAEIVLVDGWFEPMRGAEKDAGKKDQGRTVWQVRAFRGADGELLWTWRAPDGPHRSKGANFPDWWTQAVLARLDGIGPAVCLSLGERMQEAPDQGRVQLIVLDAKGKVREQTTEPFSPRWGLGLVTGILRAVDLDGDGNDELVWSLAEQEVLATRGGFARKRLLWSQPLSWVRSFDSIGAGRGAVFWRDNTLHDGKTGKPFWTLPHGTRLLPTRADAGPARFVSLHGGICRLLPTGGRTGEVRQFTGKPRTYGAEPVDSRLARGLPWVEGRSYGFLLGSAAATLLWLAVPLLLLVQAVRRRSLRWGLALLAFLGLAVCAWIGQWIPGKVRQSLTVSSLEELFELIQSADPSVGLVQLGPLFSWMEPVLRPLAFPEENRLVRVVLGVPLVLFAGVLLWAVWRQRWRRLGVLLAAMLLAAAVLAAVELAQTASEPGEYYTTEGWYLLFLPASCGVGLGVALLWLLGGAVKGVRAAIVGLRRRTRAAAA